jgi:transcriptional regulator of acetoin/glycerol metabolism
VDLAVVITAASHDQRNACARVIHATGAHARGPFVPFWSSGIAAGVDDSVAVVRALRHRFDQARGGTLFIDDIAALPDVAQWALFTLLNECAFSCARLNGAGNPLAVRIITGASRHMVIDHSTRPFCTLLFYRLNVLHLDLIDLLLQRIYNEFLEMPGLRVTSRQAQRLWGLDEQSCMELLEFLVDAKFLCRPGHGAYCRLSDGHTGRPRPRLAKADVAEPVSLKKKEAV